MSLLFQKLWAFSIAIDIGNKSGVDYLDTRIRCVIDCKLFNLHLMAIPLYAQHTAENMFNAVKRVLDSLHPQWAKKMIGVTTDGAANMIGCHSGLVTRLENIAWPGLYRIWCGAHQLDLVIKHSITPLLGEKFVFVLQNLITFLNKSNDFSRENGKCPRLVQTRWLSMGNVLKWLVEKEIE